MMIHNVFRIAYLILMVLSQQSVVSAFVLPVETVLSASATPSKTRCHQVDANAMKENGGDESNIHNSRRELLSQFTAVTLASQLLLIPTNAWAASTTIGSRAENPIVILGAGGRVGALCTQILADQGLYVRATTRSGRSILEKESKFVSYMPADVTSYSSLNNALKGASGAIFAASASGKKAGGEPPAVEFLGAYNTAKACLANNVAKLVLISSTAVTRPDSLGFKATNFSMKFIIGDRVMDAKIAGESAIRDLYADSNGPAYCIVRPGGLQDREVSAGSQNVHVSQGDVYASEIGRIDVAEVCIAALLKGKATDFTTLEVNLVEGLTKCQQGMPDLPKELVHAGAPSFDALLDGLLTDSEIKAKYPEIVNADFRGNGLPSLEKLLAQ